MGAQILKIPELSISEVEAKKLDAAINDVMRFYTDVELSPVVQAWLNLAMVGGVLYGPRWMAYNIRAKKAKTVDAAKPYQTAPAPAPASSAPASNVTQIRPAPKPAASEPKPQPAPAMPSISLQDWSYWNAQSAAIPVNE